MASPTNALKALLSQAPPTTEAAPAKKKPTPRAHPVLDRLKAARGSFPLSKKGDIVQRPSDSTDM